MEREQGRIDSDLFVEDDNRKRSLRPLGELRDDSMAPVKTADGVMNDVRWLPRSPDRSSEETNQQPGPPTGRPTWSRPGRSRPTAVGPMPRARSSRAPRIHPYLRSDRPLHAYPDMKKPTSVIRLTISEAGRQFALQAPGA